MIKSIERHIPHIPVISFGWMKWDDGSAPTFRIEITKEWEVLENGELKDMVSWFYQDLKSMFEVSKCSTSICDYDTERWTEEGFFVYGIEALESITLY